MNKKTIYDSEAIKCKQIKKLLERISDIDDIGVKKRDRYLSDYRKCYCYLARRYTKASLDVIGKILRPDFDHATVLHNIKRFNELYPLRQLDCIEEYETALKAIRTLKYDYKKINEDIQKVHFVKGFSYVSTLIQIISKGHSIILKKDAEIFRLKKELNECRNILIRNMDDLILN